MKALNYWYLLAACAIAGCHNAETAKSTNNIVANPETVLQQPFRYHKLIEVAPGMDYDIFSWGRGPATSSAYLILRSDSVDKKYTSTTGDVDGKLVDAFNTDLDTDGNPEIFIQSQTADSTGYNKIEVYEYNDNGVHKLDFPKLTSSQKKGYHGGDDFTVKENKLVRTYTIYDSDNANAKPTGEKRTLEYSFHNNDFSAKQISAEDAATSAVTPKTTPAPAPVKHETTTKKAPVKQKEHHQEHKSRSEHQQERHHERQRQHKAESKHRSAAHHQESSKRHKRHRR